MSTKLVLMSRFTWNSPNDPGDFRECFLPSLDQTQQTVRSALELVLKVTSSHASSRIGICSCVRLCSCIARKKWHVAVVLVCAPNTANNTKTMLTEESNKILAQSKTTKQGRSEPYDRLYILFCTHKKPLRVLGNSELRQQYWEGFKKGIEAVEGSWENNRDCHITMPLSLKTMEVQIKRSTDRHAAGLKWLKAAPESAHCTLTKTSIKKWKCSF